MTAIPLPAWPARRFDPWRFAVGLFGTPLNAVLSFASLVFLALVVPPLVRWGLTDATFRGTSQDCLAASGACWAFVAAKLRFVLFAFFPPALHWRPALVIVLLLGLVSASALPRLWGAKLLLAWPLVLGLCWVLMSGPPLLSRVSVNQWGGLPITLFVWAACFASAFPLALLLALARRSDMGLLRLISVGFIELMRATPMVAILYVAMLILPMALPGGALLDKIGRAMIMLVLFWSAYLAEVIRAGLQTIPRGQEEAAASLGLGYWRTIRLVVLPQALRVVIPGIVNLAIGFLLATSLLAVIGVFDLLNAARAAATDPAWLGFYDESYLLVATIYFVLCFAGSRYSLWLERRLNPQTR
ncbi:MAG: amino acid ABC transporter permease [Mesorhizobium amorphae]|nr:MAG: amino acid ABC transporter permease [Mesorhizobium amorphae]